MASGPFPILDDDADAPPVVNAGQIMDDLAEAEADEAAGRTECGERLLAELDKAAAEIRSKSSNRRP